MPREIITIQVGQCGNQIGRAFWELLLEEHSLTKNQDQLFDSALSSFFKNYDKDGYDISKKTDKQINCLKARSIMVDSEEGVINQLFKSKIADLFDFESQVIQGVSGAGNNWAHGYYGYGGDYHEEIFDKIRKETEEADSLQCFLIFHSLGGGTGSGLGSYITEKLKDDYPEIYNFNASVFPSNDDDVVTSPYNCAFSTQKLIEFSDCVFPIDNDSLQNLTKGIGLGDSKEDRKKVFNKMNNIIAHLLSNLTSSMRFPGRLNVDLNEITMNLVPFPKLHFLLSSMSPLKMLLQKKQPRHLNQIFKDILLPENQLVDCRPTKGTYLAIGLLLRGNIAFSEVSYNIEQIKKKANMIWWNREGFKFGICDQKPIYNVN